MDLPVALTVAIDNGLELIYSLRPVVEPTVVLVPDFLKGHVENLSRETGFDEHQLCYGLGLFMCYPFAMIMNTIPFGQARYLYSFLTGVFLLQFIMGVQWIHQLVASLVVYAMFSVLPRKRARISVPVFVSLYVFSGHLHRQYTNYLGWDLDFTSSMMVLMQKCWMMAFNLYDAELLANGTEKRAAMKCAPFALQELPGLIEFLGYTFCFSSVLCGPCFEFSVYRNACEGSHLCCTAPGGKPRWKIPGNVWVTVKPLLFSLICMRLHMFGKTTCPLYDPEDSQKNLPVVLTEDFLAKPFFYRLAYLWIGSFLHRMKYYFAWKNMEGVNNLWYLGFEGFDENGFPKGWGNSNNVDMIAVELSPNVQNQTKGWNKKTSLWLQRYAYFRTNGSLIAVYSLSASWHGFYPGYYMFLLSVAFMTLCERLGREKISPYFSPGTFTFYNLACFLFTSIIMQYLLAAFIFLSFRRAWATWKSFYFFGHVLCAVFYCVVSQLPTPKTKQM